MHGVGVLGGVAPTTGPDAAEGGIIQLAVHLAPLLTLARVPLGVALTAGIRLVKPLAGTGLDLYAAVQPPGDKNLLSRPEFKAMFLDDLLHGSRFQTSAPISDLVLFTRDWGFALADVTVPVRWWHGDEDHIVPFAHGQHVVDRLPDATIKTIDGESHLGGLGIAEEVIATLMELGPRRAQRAGSTRSASNHPPHGSQWGSQLQGCHSAPISLIDCEPPGKAHARDLEMKENPGDREPTERRPPRGGAHRLVACSSSTRLPPHCAPTSSGRWAASSTRP